MLTFQKQAAGSEGLSDDEGRTAESAGAPAAKATLGACQHQAGQSGHDAYPYRRRPCGGCPWRVDRPGAFPPAAFRRLASNAYDMSRESFVCHESSEAAPRVCAGFLLRGAEHNLAVRLHLMRGEMDPAALHDGGHALHASYRDMAIANGVDPDDPTLAACRDGSGPSR